jgi:hypothetical protein
MSSDEEKAQALAALIGELNAASELTMGKRMSPGRVEGAFAGMEGGPEEEDPDYEPGMKIGGKRRLRGGAACDNRYVSLAVDSAIILAGAGAIVGAGYGGLVTLQYYMAIYGLDAATSAAITALYNTLASALSGAITAGSAAMGAAGTTLKAAAPVVGSVGSALGKVAGPAVGATVRAAPAMLLGRYLSIGFRARQDAMDILNALNAQYAKIADYTGAMTRSMTAKKAALEEQIASISASTRGAYESVRVAATSAATATSGGYAAVKAAICNFIDRVNTGAANAADAALAFSGIFASELGDISGSMGGRHKRRTRKNKNKGKKSRKGKSRKNKRRSHRRR